MAAKVDVGPNAYGVAQHANHPTADDAKVQDGHLVLTGWNGRTDVVVAIYAPKTWQSVVVSGEEESAVAE